MLFYSKLVSDEFYFVQMVMMAVKSVSLIFSWEITEDVEAVIADFSGFLTYII